MGNGCCGSVLAVGGAGSAVAGPKGTPRVLTARAVLRAAPVASVVGRGTTASSAVRSPSCGGRPTGSSVVMLSRATVPWVVSPVVLARSGLARSPLGSAARLPRATPGSVTPRTVKRVATRGAGATGVGGHSTVTSATRIWETTLRLRCGGRCPLACPCRSNRWGGSTVVEAPTVPMGSVPLSAVLGV